MKKRSLFLLLTSSIILSFISCKKSTGGGSPTTDNNPLIGSWQLVSENWQNYSSLEYTDGADLKQVNSYSVVTSNPSGIISFSDSVVTISNLGYSLTSAYADRSYKNKVLTDSAIGTTTRTLKDTSMTNIYQLIGKDSIFFPHASYILTILGSVGAATTAASGASFVIKGNTLTITGIVDSVAHVSIYSGTVLDTVRTNNRTVAVFQKQ